ncbi:MAG: hypothetical protein JWN48_3434 [Myxococcaceae bacterium]|nr:hypothetical protein [Myxococcaceae bacterium]
MGCDNLIGLKDRHLLEETSVQDGGADAALPVSDAGPAVLPPEFTAYCEQLLGGSPDGGACGAVYPSKTACEQVSATLPHGLVGEDPNDPSNGIYNTFACRQSHAATALKSANNTQDCIAAGPGGGGQPGCGDNCESYCYLYQAACPSNFMAQAADLASCETKCGALRDTGKVINSANGADHEGNTVQCRLVHVSNALAYKLTNPSDPNVHCDHAALRASMFCLDEPSSPFACDNYCNLVATACTNEQKLYENKAQCLSVCKAFDPGTSSDMSTGNTLTCRYYHGNNALLLNASHCGHAGPGGWDSAHCGDECASYCHLAKTACGTSFSDRFPGGDEAACRAACAPLQATPPSPTYAGYNVAFGQAAIAKGDSLQCRLYYTVKALEDPAGAPVACMSALGAGNCAAK